MIKLYNYNKEAKPPHFFKSLDECQHYKKETQLKLDEYYKLERQLENQKPCDDCNTFALMNKYIAQSHWKDHSVWSKTEFMWDVEHYANMIDESGKDLENEYIYYENFIKTLQIVLEHSRQDYMRIEDKIKQSGALQNEIRAQLSFNSDNEKWFDGEIKKLVMKYSTYGDKKENKLPEEMIHVSQQVVPGVEDQNVLLKSGEVWDVNYDDEYKNKAKSAVNKNQTENNKINSGLLPFGYLKEGEIVNILYVEF